MKERAKRAAKVIIILFAAGIVYTVLHFKTGIGLPCVLYELTGLYCPGCGISRCIWNLMNLRFYEAFRSNRAVVILLPFLCYLFGILLYRYIVSGKQELTKWENRMTVFMVVILIIFGIVRNIPVFSCLQPVSFTK